MTDKVKNLASEIWRVIQGSKRVLLHCHPNPDPDSVGSALATAHALRGVGKEVTVIAGDSPLNYAPEVFPGFETIVPKNWSEIQPSEFDLFICLDAHSANRVTGKSPVIFPPNLKTVMIDHHSGGGNFCQLELIEPDYPATAQILFDLFSVWQIALTPEIATCLLLGLYTDTGGFKYPRTSPETFRAAATLVSLAPNYPDAIFAMENNNRPETVFLQGLALSHIETVFGGRVALASVSFDEIKAKGIDPELVSSGGVAATLRSVKGWEITAFLKEFEPGVVGVSLRTRDAKKYDLTKITAHLGGGGHPAAAGATIHEPLNMAKKLVIEAIDKEVGSMLS